MRMIKLILIVAGFFAIQRLAANGGNEQNSKDWISKIKWDSPERVNIPTLDAIYDQGDSLYKHIKELGQEIVFYDVRMIANYETGDTIVAVVDEDGNIRSRYLALQQYMNTIDLAMALVSDGAILTRNALAVRKDISKIVNLKNPFESMAVISTATKAINQIRKMYGVVSNDVVKSYIRQKNKIKKYIKQVDVVSDLTDPSLRHIPEVVLDNTAVLTKTDKEIMEGLGQSETEDAAIKDSMDILEELNKLD